jgi:hypothetical protein
MKTFEEIKKPLSSSSVRGKNLVVNCEIVDDLILKFSEMRL